MVKMRLLKLLVVAILISTSLTTIGIPKQVAAAGWLGSWSQREAIYLDHTKFDSNLSNFPILLKLGTSAGKN